MILLDTHTLLWALGQPSRLGPKTKAALLGGSDVRYSSITVTELRIKEMLGRLSLPPDLFEQIQGSSQKRVDEGSESAGVE